MRTCDTISNILHPPWAHGFSGDCKVKQLGLFHKLLQQIATNLVASTAQTCSLLILGLKSEIGVGRAIPPGAVGAPGCLAPGCC